MKSLMRDEIKIYSDATRNVYGKTSPTAFSTTLGRFIEEDRLVRLQGGEELMSSACVYLPADTDTDNGRRIDYSDKSYKVIKIQKPKTSRKAQYIKAYLKVQAY